MNLLPRATTAFYLVSGALLLAPCGFSDIIPVNNPSFETLPAGGLNMSCGTGCAFSVAPIPGWNSGTGVGQLMPSVGPGGIFNTFAPNDGTVSAYSNAGTISQVAGATVQPRTIYTLTVDIGRRTDTAFAGSAALLVGGQTFLATGTPPTPGNWSVFTATFTSTPAQAGDTITIQLSSSGIQANFDSVQLVATPVPEPGFFALAGIGVAGLWACARRRRSG
ncbi:MAG TPA: PEP-CTERM sorting domain-containing protein [Bryobacteraceae bacterium]|jgi:hypothetical protein|nr:PEP-CTERM sorting domain-containing protein [Bryobacteraceae bacterium]